MIENNQQPDPAKGIKESVEHIIGVPLTLKPKKKNKEDTDREQFQSLINMLEHINMRSYMAEDIGINTDQYDELFYNVIDPLIIDKYGNECVELIFFYVYERVNEDGTINELVDNNNNVVILNNSLELWELCKLLIKNKK